jgi:hypothetical protein
VWGVKFRGPAAMWFFWRHVWCNSCQVWRTWLRVTDKKRNSLRFLNKLRYYIKKTKKNREEVQSQQNGGDVISSTRATCCNIMSQLRMCMGGRHVNPINVQCWTNCVTTLSQTYPQTTRRIRMRRHDDMMTWWHDDMMTWWHLIISSFCLFLVVILVYVVTQFVQHWTFMGFTCLPPTHMRNCDNMMTTWHESMRRPPWRSVCSVAIGVLCRYM